MESELGGVRWKSSVHWDFDAARKAAKAATNFFREFFLYFCIYMIYPSLAARNHQYVRESFNLCSLDYLHFDIQRRPCVLRTAGICADARKKVSEPGGSLPLKGILWTGEITNTGPFGASIS